MIHFEKLSYVAELTFDLIASIIKSVFFFFFFFFKQVIAILLSKTYSLIIIFI